MKNKFFERIRGKCHKNATKIKNKFFERIRGKCHKNAKKIKNKFFECKVNSGKSAEKKSTKSEQSVNHVGRIKYPLVLSSTTSYYTFNATALLI